MAAKMRGTELALKRVEVFVALGLNQPENQSDCDQQR
jgi:hypothetical protein